VKLSRQLLLFGDDLVGYYRVTLWLHLASEFKLPGEIIDWIAGTYSPIPWI